MLPYIWHNKRYNNNNSTALHCMGAFGSEFPLNKRTQFDSDNDILYSIMYGYRTAVTPK